MHKQGSQPLVGGSIPMASVATPNTVVDWRQSLKVSDDDIVAMGRWDVNQTVRVRKKSLMPPRSPPLVST